MKVALSIGHQPYAQGHAHENKTEYSECSAIVGIIQKVLTRANVKSFIVPTGHLSEKTHYINQLWPEVAVEIHLNDFHQRAVGCETLYHDRFPESETLANIIQGALVRELKNRDRGIKLRRDLHFLRNTDCPAVIVEPFFMRWESQFLNNSDYERIARAVAYGILGAITA